MLTKRDYQDAINSQDAVNASGLVHSLQPIMVKLADSAGYIGTKWRNQHPIVTLYMTQIMYLNDPATLPDVPRYSEAYRFCKDAAEGKPSKLVKVDDSTPLIYEFIGD